MDLFPKRIDVDNLFWDLKEILDQELDLENTKKTPETEPDQFGQPRGLIKRLKNVNCYFYILINELSRIFIFNILTGYLLQGEKDVPGPCPWVNLQGESEGL